MNSDNPPPPLTAEQLAFVAWAREHLREWQQREAAMLKACRQHQERRECNECHRLGECVRYGNPGQPQGALGRDSRHWPRAYKPQK